MVWLLIPLCTTNYVSTYTFTFTDLYIDSINGRPMVPCIYFVNIYRFFNHQCQALSLQCIIMRLSTVCLGILPLTGTVAAPQNDEKGQCQFGRVCSHLPQWQRGGVRPVLLIPPSCVMGCHQASFQCNQL